MAKLIAPNGKEIQGTFEVIYGCAAIVDPRMEDGKLEFDWGGGTDVWWDTQTTETDPMNDRKLYVDISGEIWGEHELKLIEEEE
jgi:hypothetical protein